MKIVSYIKGSFDELINKVTWPTWEELQNSAVVVAIASLIIALIIFIMDFFFGINAGKELEDGTIINSVENRFVSFPANIKHRGTSCTDKNIRMVINFNYIK